MMAGDFDFGKISTSDDVDLNSIKDVDVPDERSLEASVDADDKYDVFGDVEWLRASKQLQADLGSGEDAPPEFREHESQDVNAEAANEGADNYDAEVKADEGSQQLDFKSLEQGVKLFDGQMFEGGSEDNLEFYDDLPDEDEDDGEWEDDVDEDIEEENDEEEDEQ